MRREHFGDAAHVSADHQEAAASSFQNGNAEGLGKACVEEDMTSAQDVAHLVVAEGT